jgi:hypothetical protein
MSLPQRALEASIESIEARVLLAADVLPPPTREFLSDLTPSYVMNGFGPIGINLSNGEEAAEDGKRLRLNNRRYEKGIGVHSYSEIRYALRGEYRSFISDVGMDDEVGTGGSVVFQVFADGTKLFDSGVITGRSAFKRVNVDVAGRNELTLIVRDAGDGTDNDHGDWADAQLRRHIGALPDVDLPKRITLDEPNSTLRVNGSFADAASDGPWTATVDWGDGTGIKRIDASDDGEIALRHKFDPAFPGTYNVALHVSNGQATGFATCQVTVNNAAPTHVALMGADDKGRLFTTAGFEFVGYGVFEDPGKLADESYTYRVNFGDGSPIETGDVPARLFFLNHTFERAGTYTVAMSIIDEAGNVGSGINTLVVNEPTITHLSDVTPTRASDGGAGFVRDVNSRNGGDIKLNGKRFAKGLGVTAISDLTYDLSGGNHRALMADIGMDDYGNGESSVIFRVFTDGNEIFNSGAMNNESDTQRINLDITGAQSLRLLVTDASDGAATGFADWAGVRIV